MTFGTRLKELLNESAMTQKVMAASIGVSQGSVSGWIKGTTVPEVATGKKIANLFGVSTSWLLYGEGVRNLIPAFTNPIPFGRFKLVLGEPKFIEEEPFELGFSSDRTSLKAICLNSSLMQPSLAEGDILLIDTGKTDIESRAPYALFIGQRFIVADVNISLTGEVVVSTTNPPECVTLKEPPVVIGRIVKRISNV